MAKLFYQLGGPGQINVYNDPQGLVETDLQSRSADLQVIRGLSDSARAAISTCGVPEYGVPGFPNPTDFDDFLDDEIDRLLDILDYFSYTSRVENLTVRDGAWFTPEAIESFCGEHVTNLATNSVDGDNTTIWQHFQTHRHSILYRLRGYSKKITRIRFRYGGAEPAREQLTNLDVRSSKSLNMILNPSNLLEAGINITWPTPGGVWVEHTLANSKFNGRYIQLDFDTADASSNAQIREFAVWVETRNHKK